MQNQHNGSFVHSLHLTYQSDRNKATSNTQHYLPKLPHIRSTTDLVSISPSSLLPLLPALLRNALLVQCRAGFLHELAHRRVLSLVLRVVVRAEVVVVVAAAVGVAADASSGAGADAGGLGFFVSFG